MNKLCPTGTVPSCEPADRLLRVSEDPTTLTPHKRLRELTAILANGINRLRADPSELREYHQIQAESSPTGLDPVARSGPDGAVFTT